MASDAADPRMTMELSHLVFDLVVEMRRFFVRTAAEHGLTPNQLSVLYRLGPGEPASMAQLVDATGVDPSNLASVVTAMEGRGWVRRQVSPHDRRSRQILLTADGEALRGRVVTALDEGSPARAHLDAAEVRRLHGLLKRRAGG